MSTQNMHLLLTLFIFIWVTMGDDLERGFRAIVGAPRKPDVAEQLRAISAKVNAIYEKVVDMHEDMAFKQKMEGVQKPSAVEMLNDISANLQRLRSSLSDVSEK